MRAARRAARPGRGARSPPRSGRGRRPGQAEARAAASAARSPRGGPCLRSAPRSWAARRSPHRALIVAEPLPQATRLAQLDAHPHSVPAVEGVRVERDDGADGVELIQTVEGSVVKRLPPVAAAARHRAAVPRVPRRGVVADEGAVGGRQPRCDLDRLEEAGRARWRLCPGAGAGRPPRDRNCRRTWPALSRRARRAWGRCSRHTTTARSQTSSPRGRCRARGCRASKWRATGRSRRSGPGCGSAPPDAVPRGELPSEPPRARHCTGHARDNERAVGRLQLARVEEGLALRVGVQVGRRAPLLVRPGGRGRRVVAARSDRLVELVAEDESEELALDRLREGEGWRGGVTQRPLQGHDVRWVACRPGAHGWRLLPKHCAQG
eukprot:scaffold57311_cov56-Phaeocystis_antarctica.AAC.2